MPYITLTSGLTIKAPTRGTRSWAQTMLDDTFRKISSHDHTGSPNGAQIATAAIASNAVTGPKIRLANAEWLRGRNAAGNGDVNIIRVSASDTIEFDSSIDGSSFVDSSITDAKIRLRNAQYLRGRNALGSADVNILKVNTSDDVEIENIEKLSNTGAQLKLRTASAHSLVFGTNDTDRWAINSSGHVIPQGTTKTLDIGASSTRVRAIYGETLDLSGRDYATWTPTMGGSGSMTVGTITNNFSRYITDQKTVFFETNLVFTTSGTASDTVTFTLPVAPRNASAANFACLVYDGTKGSGKQAAGVAICLGSGTVNVRWYDNSNWTLAVGCALYVRGQYEIS